LPNAIALDRFFPEGTLPMEAGLPGSRLDIDSCRS
jgi:hypothetical protein